MGRASRAEKFSCATAEENVLGRISYPPQFLMKKKSNRGTETVSFEQYPPQKSV
jgi:hypothetical protein